jgi:HmuY protein
MIFINQKILFSFLLILILNSCVEEESALSPHELVTDFVQIQESIYDYVSYFDLESRSVVMSIPARSWDLAFSCSPYFHYVKLSTGRGTYAGSTGLFDFDNSQNAETDSLWIDNPKGELDSTVIGRWWKFSANEKGQSPVYIISRKLDQEKNDLGKWLFQILEANEYEYKIIFSDYELTEKFELIIPKDPDYDFVYVDFSRPSKVLNLEPKKGEYDLYFGPFTNYEYYEDKSIPPIQYKVWGVLTNRPNVKSGLITDLEYRKVITSSNVELSLDAEKIGISWKKYIDSRYQVFNDKTYFINNRNGINYKLRFYDYYKNGTQKGFPKFEFDEL